MKDRVITGVQVFATLITKELPGDPISLDLFQELFVVMTTKVVQEQQAGITQLSLDNIRSALDYLCTQCIIILDNQALK